MSDDTKPVPYNRGVLPEGVQHVDADKKRKSHWPLGCVPADSYVWDEGEVAD